MCWQTYTIRRLQLILKLLLSLFFVGQTLLVVAETSKCDRNDQLSVYQKTVEQKGYRFEKLEVNRSHPVSVVYRILTSSEVESLMWKHNGQEMQIDTNPKLTLHYSVDRVNMALIVTLNMTAPNARSAGSWELTLITDDKKQHSEMCYVASPPILHPMIGAVRTHIGSPLSVNCPFDSVSEAATITWNRVVDSSDGQKILESVDDASFRSEGDVTNAIMEWPYSPKVGGLYLCTAVSLRGKDSTLIEVRIKDYKTYLWPSIGILSEVLILAFTIAAYEMYKSKKRKAEEAATSK